MEAHGSFARQRCIECKTQYPDDLMHEHIGKGTVPRCQDETCKGLVKPDIVFFGEQLPSAFFEKRGLPAAADLAIVMGTSLTVQPFASLPGICRDETPRLLINKERVGDLGCRADDVTLLTDCDEGVKQLAKACGWLEELEDMWAKTAPASAEKIQSKLQEEPTTEERVQKTNDELVADEVEKLTRQIDESLKLSQEHKEKAREHLESSELAKKVPQDLEGSSKDPETTSEPVPTTKTEGAGLDHVFPHLDKKSSL